MYDHITALNAAEAGSKPWTSWRKSGIHVLYPMSMHTFIPNTSPSIMADGLRTITSNASLRVAASSPADFFAMSSRE